MDAGADGRHLDHPLTATDGSGTANFSFAERVAIVTGATSLIGATIARAFHAAGASVVFTGRDTAGGTNLEAEIGSQRAIFVVADITVDRDLERIPEVAVERFGGIDVLVNNAVSYADSGLETTRAQWLETLDVNLVSGALLVQLAVPAMRARGGGAVVNIASVGGKFGARGRQPTQRRKPPCSS